jgi:hypothetical protein
MRSTELVGVAQPIACCGEVGGVGRRGKVAQRRMRALAVVIVGPFGDAGPGVIEAEEQGFIEKLVEGKVCHPFFKGTRSRATISGVRTSVFSSA